MTNLIIVVDAENITAAEIYCGDDLKYVEGFTSWTALFETLGKYFPEYVRIEIRAVEAS